SQISEDTTLNAFKVSGLQAELEGLARSRALTAPFYKGEFMFFSGNHVVSFVEFLASAWLREQHVIWGRSGHPEPLTVAVAHGDALGTQAVLGLHRFTKKELHRALFGAALSRYDNSAVIKLLLDAGADVNAHAGEDTTPLMLAVPHPCNLRPLLEGGADLNARDKWGRTALQIARETKQPIAFRLLEEAATKTRTRDAGV